LIFIHKGKETTHHVGEYSFWDYLIIPRGIIYQIQFDTEDNRLFYVESFAPFYPKTL
jgi:homogentisate 1,2-dioxygenase